MTLANEFVRVDILPELGARIWNLLDVEHGIQWIWHHPVVALKRLPLATPYDEHWAGGWEQLFPNDAGGEFGGRFLPDHGEWWTRAWEWELTGKFDDRLEIHFWAPGVVTRSELHKWVSLERGQRAFSVRYRIESREDQPLKFLFKEHLPLNVSPAHRLELPGGTVQPVDPSFSTRIGQERTSQWPYATARNGEVVDLGSFPDRSEGHREFIYVSDLPEGWCGVFDTVSGRRIRMHYPLDVFPYAWFFMTFGGWKDIYTVVLEPCTNLPKDLATADRLGQCAVLGPGEVFDCEVRLELS